MPREWAKMVRMAHTVDGISNGSKWPALVFDSYENASSWLIDVTPLEKLKPVLDVEDKVLFYFGRCDVNNTKGEEMVHLGIMTEERADAETCDIIDTNDADPLLALAKSQAKKFIDAPSKLRAMEILVQLIIQDSSYILNLDGNDEDSDQVDWNTLFEKLWETLEADGWSVSSFVGDEMFYLLPDTDFSNFEVDKTVFKSKRQALMKSVEYYTTIESATATAVWDALWMLMEEIKQGKIIMMKKVSCYLTPVVEKFDLIKVGETLFQTKKDAVMKFIQRIQLPTPKKVLPKVQTKMEPLVAVPDKKTVQVNTNHAAEQRITKQAAEVPVFEDSIVPQKKKSLKRKIPMQSVSVPPVTSSSRRVTKATYSWGLILGVLTDYHGWCFKPSKLGFDFIDAHGNVFLNEEEAMQYLITSDMLSDIERVLKERGAPTPEQEKENGTKHVEMNQMTKKVVAPVVETSDSEELPPPPQKKKSLKPKKRLSYSSPIPKVMNVATLKKIKLGVIERELKKLGWKWYDGALGHIYCKPHVVMSKGKKFSGTPGVDYFLNREDFELYVRGNIQLMELIYHGNLSTRRGVDHVTEVTEETYSKNEVFEMESDEEVSKNKSKPKKIAQEVLNDSLKIIAKTKSKQRAIVDPEDDSQLSVAKRASKKKALKDDQFIPRGIAPSEIKFGQVYEVLQKKGWRHGPGQFGYDYMRPNVKTKKQKILNETYYHSEADMEMHLRETGEWNKIVQRIIRSKQAAAAGLSSPPHTSSSEEQVSADTNEAIGVQSPTPGSFSRMWPRLKANGWFEKRPMSMDGEYLYCSPTGKYFSKEELEMCTVEDLIKHQARPSIVEVHDSSEEETMEVDEGQCGDIEDGDMSYEEDNNDPELDDIELTQVQETPSIARPVSTPAPDFLSPNESIALKADKSVARNVQQDFTPSPSMVKLPSDAMTSSKANSPVATSLTSPKTPSFSTTSPSKKTIFQLELERALTNLSASYKVPELLHREKEWKQLKLFADSCVHEDTRKSVFVSGTPGTGKSAMMEKFESYVADTWNNAQKSIPLQVINMNAMALGDSASIFKGIAEKVTKKQYTNSEQAIESLELAFKSTEKVTFLILDEIDILLKGKGESDLYKLFEWAHHPNSSLLFVGIANSIDMTERYLPLLRSRECKPIAIVFQPYPFDAIHDILKQRLAHGCLLEKPIIDYMSMSYVSRLVATTSGDIRNALNICKQTLKQKLIDGNESTLTLQYVMKIAKNGLESTTLKSLRTLPRISQMVVYASIHAIPIRDGVYNCHHVYDKYCQLVRKKMTMNQLITMGEFKQMLETLEAHGLVLLQPKKDLFKLYLTIEDANKFFHTENYFKQF